MNKLLKKQIDQAKQKAMNFALVGLGGKPFKLLLSKKKISDSEIKDAKEEFGGNVVLKGIVKGEGSNLVFQSLAQSTFDEGKVKKLIKEETEVAVGVEFKVAAEIEEVDEKEGETKKVEASDSIKGLTESFNKMSKTIMEAVGKYPTWKDAILKLAKKVQRELNEEDEQTANVTLIELEHFLKSLDREAQPKGPEPTNSIESAEQRRKDYINRYAPRYEVLFSTEVAYNMDSFLQKRDDLGKLWDTFNREPITKQEIADEFAKKQQEMDSLFQQLVGVPEKAIKEKKRLVTEIKDSLAALTADYDLVKEKKYNNENIVDSTFDKPFQDLRKKDVETWTSAKNFTDAQTILGILEKKMEGYMKTLAIARREALSKGQITLKFGDDETEKSESELVAEIKKYLPANGHSNISQSMNDLLLGRGKATTGHPGVLHASAGKADAAGGCTLFFERDGKGNVKVVGVGQHKTSTSYNIYHGLGLAGKVLSL